MPVYFIQAGDNGPIKIGYAKRPQERLRNLQTGHPEPLRLVGVMGGGQEDERLLHERFLCTRYRAEWFNPSSELLALIASNPCPPLPEKRRSGRPASRAVNVAVRITDALGGTSKLSRATGIPISTIDSWRESGKIPSWRRPVLIDAASKIGAKLPPEFIQSETA